MKLYFLSIALMIGCRGSETATEPPMVMLPECVSASTCPPIECTLAVCSLNRCTYSPLPEGMCCGYNGSQGFTCVDMQCGCGGDVDEHGNCACAKDNADCRSCIVH